MEEIKSILEVIALIFGIPVSVITIIKVVLKVKERKEEKNHQSIINAGNIVNSSITQTQHNQTIINVEQKIENIHQKQKKVEEISSIIENIFSKGIIIIFIGVAIVNISKSWNTDLFILDNLRNTVVVTYQAFGHISSIIIPLIFTLSVLLLIKNIIFKKGAIKTIFTLSILIYANIMNLKIFSTYSLKEQVIKMMEEYNTTMDSISIHSVFFNPISFMFILIGIIITGIYITNYLLKVTLTEIEFGPKKKFFFGTAIFIYLGIPILIFYNHLIPDITLLNIH